MLRNLSKNFLVKLLLLGTGLFLLWSCEEDSGKSKAVGKSELKVQQTLNDASTAYTFYVDKFMREGQMVFDEGNFNDVDDDVMISQVWSGVAVRWGFRRKPAFEGDDAKVYWWQKTSTDVDTQNTYEDVVAELEKAKFTPTDLPEALLDEDSIEVYVMAVVGDYKLSGSMPLPGDFKKVVLGASVIEGMVTNKTALAEARSGSKHVEGAAVFFVHRNSGKIFHGFSNDQGRYRVTVLRKDGFYVVVLRNGFRPYKNSLSVSGDMPNENVALGELATGVDIQPNQLHKITGDDSYIETTGTGYPVSGSALDLGEDSAGAGIPGAFVLLYNRDRGNEELFFLESGDTGSFNFNVPLPTDVDENDATTLSVAGAAYGYVPSKGSETIGSKASSGDTITASDILNPITFTPDPAVKTETVLTWGSTTTGGPSGFAYQNSVGGENNIPVFFDSDPVTVQMELKIAGSFVPEPIAVVWTVDGVVDSSKAGLIADFTLSTRGQHTISASITDKKQRNVTLARVFDLGSGLGPDDPIVTFDPDVIGDGTVTNTDVDGDGNIVTDIDPDQTNGDVTVGLGLKVIDPDTGGDEGVTYEWSVNGEPRGDLGPDPSFELPPGVNRVKVVITSKDGENSTTIVRVYNVAGDPATGGGTGTGGNTGNAFGVGFGLGSSGGVIASTLGIASNPLRYPVTGTNSFSVTLKALLSNQPAGALTYAWTITNPISTPPNQVVVAASTSTNKQTEKFSLPKGTHTITVSVTPAGGTAVTASRTFQIVDQANLNLPAGTTATWRAESSGGVGNLPDSSPLTTFRDDGSQSNVRIRAAADFLDAQRNPLTPVEWYIDGVLQASLRTADVLIGLPSGGGTAIVTRTVVGIARTANNEPVQLRRVFTLDPSSNNNSRGPRLTWGTSSLTPGVVQSFDGVTAKPLTLAVVPASTGSQTYTYIWSLNGNVVISQTGPNATFNLTKLGRNVVSVVVSNGEGTATIEQEYLLNTPPTVVISNPANGSNAPLGTALAVSATASDVDSPTVNYTYSWTFQRPGSSTWESIPGLNPQPTTASFSLPTTSLSAGQYGLRIRVTDGYGGNAVAVASVNFATSIQGNAPSLSWDPGSAAAGLLDFDGSTPVSVTLQVAATPSDATTTYVWSVNGNTVAGQTGASATLSLSSAGTNTVSVQVSNGANATADLARTYTLNNQPTVSISSPTSSTSVIAGRDLAVQAVATDAETNAQLLSYTWSLRRSGTTEWFTIPNMTTQPTTASFTMSARGLQAAQYNLRAQVADANGGTAEAIGNFSVVGNRVPTLGSIVVPTAMANGGTLQLNSSIRYDANETFSVVATDPDGDALTYTWFVNGVQKSTATVGTTSLNVGNKELVGDVHRLTIMVQVKDPSGAQATQAAIVRVNYRPILPALSQAGTTLTANPSDLDGDTNFTYTWTFAGPRDGSGNYASLTLPSGTDTSSASFTMPTSGLSAGVYLARVTVNDGWGGERSGNFELTIN